MLFYLSTVSVLNTLSNLFCAPLDNFSVLVKLVMGDLLLVVSTGLFDLVPSQLLYDHDLLNTGVCLVGVLEDLLLSLAVSGIS